MVDPDQHRDDSRGGDTATASGAHPAPRWPRWLMPLVMLGGIALAFTVWRLPGNRRWVSYPEAEAAAVKNVHEHDGRPVCQRCHARREVQLLRPAVELCVQCHRMTHGNHPVGVVQTPPARGLPVGPAGEIQCHTCHDPHDVRRNKAGLRLPFNDLCARCHAGHP